ncbi:putative F-box/LRR-repeat protein At3g28410 isoform X2 [Cornus florida]|uniref:putative F-box/LRR-repeat protein At3g28410 isoform X2 n=1 Tax=Cornus florida TaxID=4283 RepID=UPI0028A21BAB|nr:putative F-box/LRR-repeat protein At3g28410 isoform X2 [Cornus florida]XP_059639893.1 putative F-box/LRR-repeat protein At3g28410 isoform X2 [Cornus florida]
MQVCTKRNKMSWKRFVKTMPLISEPTRKRKAFEFAKVVTKKPRKKYVNGADEKVDTRDWISNLPEPIIHHILSFLRCPKDAARTSVLSKKWNSIWASLLTFNFDQKSFETEGKEQKKNFKIFVENSLKGRLKSMHCIQKFRLYMTSFDLNLAPHMDRWISAATLRNVKELDIHVPLKKRRCYSLPETVLTAATITSLKLYGCRVEYCSDIKLSHLKELSVKKAHVNYFMMQTLINSCPLIEDLRLIGCTGLARLHVSTLHKLNRIELHECCGLKAVEIEAPSLRTFWYHEKIERPCKIKFTACENLRNLTLKDTKMTDELLQVRISMFPVLENLVLKECNTVKRITILSQKLERLALIRCNKLEEASIDAPNLYSFEYTGDKMPFYSMNTPGLHEAKLHFESIQNKSTTCPEHIEAIWSNMKGSIGKFDQAFVWSNALEEFLGKFDQSKGLKMVVRVDENVIIHEELSKIRFPLFNDLKLDIIKSSIVLEDLINSSLRMGRHPETLAVVSSSSSEFLKVLYEKLMKREENPNCCKYYKIKCWRHDLEDVNVEICEEAENGTHPLYSRLESSSTRQQRTTFKLNWKSNVQMEDENSIKA